MLQAMRNGMDTLITRVLISLLFLFALGGLVLSDAGGFFRGGVSKGYVADIGGQELSFAEFDRAYRNALARLEIPQLAEIPEYREIVARETLKKEIRNRVLGYTARENGILISNDIAAKRLREYLKPLTDQGALESTALQQVLRNQRISENILVNNIKNDFAIELLMTSLVAPIRAPNQLVSDIEQYKAEKRSAHYVKIAQSDFNVKIPNDEKLKEYYNSKKTLWMTPEYREISVLKLTPELVLEKAMGENAVTDAEVLDLYEERIEEFSEPDKRIVSQVSFRDEKSALNMKDFLNKNRKMSLQKAVEGNKAFEGIFLVSEEYMRTTILPKELADPIFDLKEDVGIVGPIKSPLGWHLAVVEKTIRGNVKKFDEVKADLRKGLIEDKAADPMFEMVNELEDMFAAGDSVKAASDFLQLPMIKIGPVDISGKDESGKDLKLDAAMKTALRYAFATKEDDDIAAEMQELEDSSFVAFSVNNVIAPKKIDFSRVKGDVASAWKTAEQQKQVAVRVHDILSAVKSGKSRLKDHILGAKKKISVMKLQKRNDKFKGFKKEILPENFVDSIFDLDETNNITSLSVADGVYIIQLKEVKIGDAPQKVKAKNGKTDAEGLVYDELFSLSKREIEQGIRNDITEQFLHARAKKYDVEINEYSFSKQYGVNKTTKQ